ncbi:MAG: Wzz/FepE/Etk N-terminal domain-containing protein [Marinoscillum sp.]
MTNKEEYIDLRDISQEVWSKRKLCLRVTVVFLIIGFVYYLLSPDEYESRTTLMLESNQSQVGGGLSSLAGLAGINLGGTRSEGSISPQLYPIIVKTTPFLTGMAKQKFFVKDLDSTMVLSDYILQYNQSSLFDLIKAGVKYPVKLAKTLMGGGNPPAEKLVIDSTWVDLTPDERRAVYEIMSRITVELDQTMGTVSVSVVMQDKVIAAQVAQFTIDHIKGFITNYRTSKLKEDLKFVEQQLLSAKKDFQQAQYALADFRDRNKNLVTSSTQSQIDLLQAQYNLAFNVYNGLAQRLEQTKISIQENKPIFFVIEPVNVPISQSEPNLVLILIITGFLGLVGTGAWVVFRFIWVALFPSATKYEVT